MSNKTKVTPVSDIANSCRKDFFPLKLSNKVTCHVSTRKEIISFTTKNHKKIFKDEFKPLVKIKDGSKELRGFLSTCEEYRKLHAEYFVFKKEGKIVGSFHGEMEDFETFYMRNTGILPEYQGLGAYSEFLDHFLVYLKKIGYQRVSSQHATSNRSIISAKMKKGFYLVGTENHDRWGSLVKLVKFLDTKREKEFKKHF